MWYVLQYKPNQGDRAKKNLSAQGVNCFFPKISSERLKQGRVSESREPLFPGYMFVELGEQDVGWPKIRSTRGVQRLVGFSGAPASIPNAVIIQIREALSSLGDQPYIRQGQKVSLTEGPFQGLDAVFQSFDGEQRAMVLISFMQRKCSVTVPVSGLKI